MHGGNKYKNQKLLFAKIIIIINIILNIIFILKILKDISFLKTECFIRIRSRLCVFL